ncbi:MAG: ATP-dependent DNA ligase [Actinobacteria bacterium]|nr:ATP-dependent DNA ligase [Actinomycetota bacterium]
MLPFKPPLAPMLSKGKDEIPRGEGWLYEPKWDGFRVLAFLDGDEDVFLCSRNGQPLQRYFPELIPLLRESLPVSCVVDGEIIIATERGLDFDLLQMRLHPAASRVNRLAAETPASVVLFDYLAEGDRDLRPEPLAARRQALTAAVKPGSSRVRITPQTADPDEAASWFTRFEGAGCDGVVAKRSDQPYEPGKRAMIKIKHGRTCDCVVGGYRESKDGAIGTGIGSLLLGLYDEDGVFHFVGHTSSFSAADRRAVRELLQPLVEEAGFGEGRTPGAPSRWSAGKDLDWVSVRPELVCEIYFERLQGQRFRHAARFLRWRSDKDPRECDFAQLEPPEKFELEDIFA